MSQVELNFAAVETEAPAPESVLPAAAPAPAPMTVPVATPAPETHPKPNRNQRLQGALQGRNGQLALSVLMAAGLTLALYLILPWSFRYWSFALTELLGWLPLDEARLNTLNLVFPAWQDLETPAIKLWLASPDYHDWLGNLGASAVLYLLVGLLRPTLRSALRALAVFHFLTVLAQGLSSQFPYDVEDHTRSLSVLTIGLLLCLPLVMAATHYIVERSHERRALATVLIAAWLILSLPLKLLTHVAMLKLASPLAMPTLFMVFGPALDIMIVSALYAWVVTWRHNPG